VIHGNLEGSLEVTHSITNLRKHLLQSELLGIPLTMIGKENRTEQFIEDASKSERDMEYLFAESQIQR